MKEFIVTWKQETIVQAKVIASNAKEAIRKAKKGEYSESDTDPVYGSDKSFECDEGKDA